MAAVRGEVDVEQVDPEQLLAQSKQATAAVSDLIRSGMEAANAVSGQSSGNDTKIRLSAMKILTPAIAAVIYRPGMDGAAEDKKAALSSILASINEATSEVCRLLDPDVPLQKWAVAGVKQLVAEMVSVQWKEIGNSDISAQLDLLRNLQSDKDYKAFLCGVSADSFHKPESGDEAETMLHVSFLNGAAKLQREIINFSFYADQRVLLDRLMEKCSEIASIDCPEIASAADVMHYQSAFGRAVELMQAEYRATAKLTVDDLVAADDRGEYVTASRQVKNDADKTISQIETRAEKGFKSLLSAANRMVEIQMQRRPQEGNAHGFKS